MPTKPVNETAANQHVELFLRIGLEEKTARNTIAKNKVTNNLLAVIHEAGAVGCDRTAGNLLYTVATKFPVNALVYRPKLLEYIMALKIKSPAQLDAAFSFFSSVGSEEFSVVEFEEACGVGIEISSEEIEKTVNDIFEVHKSLILEKHYRTNVGELFAHVRERQRWADPKIVKQTMETKLHDLLGERNPADDEKPYKKKKDKPVKIEQNVADFPSPPSEEELNPFSIFLPPEENFKAMFVDFGLAKDRDGECYLRYDDTNPEAEKQEYIDHIEEIVKWMGWEPNNLFRPLIK